METKSGLYRTLAMRLMSRLLLPAGKPLLSQWSISHLLLLLCVQPTFSGVTRTNQPPRSHLDPPPIELWTGRYNAFGDGSNKPTRIAIDDSGHVYVTGTQELGGVDMVTIKYDSSGHELWIAGHDGTAAAFELDRSGNVYVVGTDSDDVVTIKYDASGVVQWESRYDGGEDYATDIAIDDSGNVFVTGTTGDAPNLLTIKYNSAGMQQWVQEYHGGGQGAWPRELAADGSGGVWVTGAFHYEFSLNKGLGFQMIALKYGSSGHLDESIVIGGKGSNDIGKGIVVDNGGNVFLVGDSQIDESDPVDYGTFKYDRDGNRLWAAYYDGQEGEGDYPNDIALDRFGNVIVTGVSNYVYPYDWVLATVKYDGSGEQQWAALSSIDLYIEEENSLAVDDEGGIYVIGQAFDLGTGDYVTIKYDSSGVEQWVVRYNGPSSGHDYPHDIAVDNSGAMYVTGLSQNAGGTYDYLTIKYGFLPGKVDLVFPEDHSVVTSDTVQLSWNKGRSNVDRYWLEGDTDSLFLTPFVDSLLTDTMYLLTPLHHNSTLWWKVRAHNSVGWGEFSEARSFFVYQEIPAPPVLLLPSDSATEVAFNPTLSWSTSPGSEFYTLQLSDTLDFSRLIVDEDSIEVTSLDVSGLMGITIYYWRVSATNGLGTSLWSEVWSFTTLLPLPARVTLVSPVNGATIPQDSVRVLWRPSQLEIDRYWFDYAIDSSFATATTDSSLSDTTTVVHNLQDHETYYWRVRAHNATGWGPFSTVQHFLILTSAPMSPPLVSPPDGATNQPLNVTFLWRTVSPTLLKQMIGERKEVTIEKDEVQVKRKSRAKTSELLLARGAHLLTETLSSPTDTVWYHLQLASDAGFDSLFVNDSTLVDTTGEVSSLRIDTTYYWRVQARNLFGASSWSDAWSFTTLPIPAQVVLASPENGAVVAVGGIVCRWFSSTPEIERYWFEWASDSLFIDARIDSTGGDTISIASPLQNNQTYYWKVRAHNEAGWGLFSDVWSFSVLITGVGEQEEIPTVFSLSQNYPNPFNPSTTIRYGLPEKADVRLELFNVLGQRVALLVDQSQEPGYHSIELNASGLGSGVYFYRLHANQFVQVKTLLLLR